MKIFPAIDLFGKKAVRLFQGDYQQMTVYSDNPVEIAKDFLACGAKQMHVVDLEGAKTGETPNFSVIKELTKAGLFTEVGGGIRSMETVRRYVDCGVGRVILGTAAVTDPAFLQNAVAEYGEKIAVGVDIKDGFVAIRGWTEKSAETALDFCKKMENIGVKTVICTDIGKDGAMKGANLALYKELNAAVNVDFIASGGVSFLSDVEALKACGMYGAIVGKAYYEKTLDLKQVIETAK